MNIDNTLLVLRNRWEVNEIDRERGWMWAQGKKYRTPDAPVLLVPVMPRASDGIAQP